MKNDSPMTCSKCAEVGTKERGSRKSRIVRRWAGDEAKPALGNAKRERECDSCPSDPAKVALGSAKVEGSGCVEVHYCSAFQMDLDLPLRTSHCLEHEG